MIDKKSVIVFGPGNYNTLGVLHELVDCNYDILLLIVGKSKEKNKGNIIGYSKYARKIKEVNNEKEGIDWILENKEKFEKDTFIYPTSDTCVLVLDEYYDLLLLNFKFPNGGKKGAINFLMNKSIQNQLASKFGLKIIKSIYLTTPEITDFSFDFPCMVKIMKSVEGSKGDMAVCRTETELKDALKDCSFNKSYIVQSYIDNEYDILLNGISYQNGFVWIPAAVIKPGVSAIGEYSHAIVTTDVVKYVPELDKVKEFVKSLGFFGPFSVEFGHEKGQNYFFEINLRNDGTSHYLLKTGANIAASFLRDSNDLIDDSISYKMIDETSDLRRVFNKEISFKDWWKEFINAGSYKFYNKSDYGLLMPVLYMFINRGFDKFIRTIKR